MADTNITRLAGQRETGDRARLRFERSLQVCPPWVQRMGLEAELSGHSGCVNCLEWNEQGTLLASGSDDLNAIIWQPLVHKQLCLLRTGHQGNIFSVKFLPSSGDRIVATAAADCKVHVHDINTKEVTQIFTCHTGRVKRLATAPNVPYMFWSASEDGTIRQFDLRMSSRDAMILVDLTQYCGTSVEVKCISINPRRPEMMATGANDPYIRMYDTRAVTAHRTKHAERRRGGFHGSSEAELNLPAGCAQYYVAGHLPMKQSDYQRRFRTLVSTYVTFSPDGNELLVNLGGEQVYLFDVIRPRKPHRFQLGDYMPATLQPHDNGVVSKAHHSVAHAAASTSNGVTNGIAAKLHHTNGFSLLEGKQQPRTTLKPVGNLPPRADALKLRANEVFCRQQFSLAIALYNQAIQLSPNSGILYGNRAAAYMKRGWDGDIYSALRDCHTALSIDPNHIKAHFRLARCLHELQWTKESLDCLNQFRGRFPEHAHSQACDMLDKDIKASLFSKSDHDEDKSTKSDTSPNRRRQGDAVSEAEKTLREKALDYETRFCGHCNTTTDIKEANFFGNNGQYIVAGSDDGSFFMWEKKTTNIVRVLRGDDSIVNCLQPHPSHCLLATSGIDPVVRLWSPRPEDGSNEERLVEEMESAALANQKRMNADPLEVMLLNMGYRITGISEGSDDEAGDGPAQCRPS
ncbi:WD and tetratricopeptide repeats protein 1-like [Branchiostoma lanceolatum]|uniref:WD and tetratricopeptide repeats protein 1-like n=1 Tax=Branchiostoma lanceolatum TaxID=7740 RepID=UPI003453E0E1